MREVQRIFFFSLQELSYRLSPAFMLECPWFCMRSALFRHVALGMGFALLLLVSLQGVRDGFSLLKGQVAPSDIFSSDASSFDIFSSDASSFNIFSSDASSIPVFSSGSSFDAALSFSSQASEIPPSVCGDGFLEGMEECELGTSCSTPGLFCDLRACTCVQFSGKICGNGALDPGEQCEVGAPCPLGWRCDFPNCRCAVQAMCGDDRLDPGEQCEVNQPCSGENQTCDFLLCRCRENIVPCGNGVEDPGEECDDGNTVDGDGCSPVCTWEFPVAPPEERLIGSLIPLSPLSAIPGSTGPAAVAVLAAGAAAGFAWFGRKRRG